jgi:uncharacterized membrane protein YqjE
VQGERDDSIPPDGDGPVSSLFKSLANLFATLIAIAQTRIELLTTELQSEVEHTAAIVVWIVVALVAAAMGIFSVALLAVVLLWDSHRLIASSAVIAVFFTIAVVAALVARAKMRGKPRLLAATLAELSKDREQLAGRKRE